MADSIKLRKYDVHPDEFIAGTMGLGPELLGVYWMVCLLIYSSGGPISIDDDRLFAYSGLRTRSHLRRLLDQLIDRGKLTLDGVEMHSRRCRDEIETASRRVRSAIENGSKGGRPKHNTNEINYMENPTVVPTESSRARSTNYQLPTTKEGSKKENPLSAPLANGYDPTAAGKSAASRASPKAIDRGSGGSRLPAEFVLPPDWITEGELIRKQSHLPPMNLKIEADKFADYWHAKTGAAATKRDWHATWRNWCRNATPSAADRERAAGGFVFDGTNG